MQTRDQKNAAIIFGQAKEVACKGDTFKQKYGSVAQKLPILIRTAGLVQALEFVNTRDKPDAKDEDKPHCLLLENIATTLTYPSAKELLNASRTSQLSEYMYLTQQVLATLLWYKRFAQSVLNVDPTEGGNET